MSAFLPRTLGRYTLTRLLGEGGQGRVYDAVHHGPGGLERRVAVKVLSGGGDLHREARLTSLLRHPHLVDVYEVGEADGVGFCAMERCDGGSLEGRAPLPPRAVVEVGLQVCAALQYAHEELGLVHLDLKPANLLLHGGEVKVADLGIAAARGFETTPGSVRGTPRYMAPEHRAGGPIDARADIYALGRVLLELAAGGAEAVDVTLDLDAEGPAPEAPSVAWLEPLVARLTRADAARRPGSMAAVAALLRGLEVEGPGLVEAVGAPPPRAPARDPLAAAGPEVPLEGRSADRVTLAAALEGSRAVHLHGGAGMGKSALARAEAWRWRRAGHPVAWVDVAERRHGPELVAGVAAALDLVVRRADDGSRVAGALAERGHSLLVLDGVDDLEAAATVEAWCTAAPALRVLSTGRGPVAWTARTLPVGPLPTEAAVALLVRRAVARGADVAGDPALIGLAEALDGVPLALELAAGRLGVLSPAEVAERLSLSLLRSAHRGPQASLRAALDTTWERLPTADRRAFAALSVFRGGFTPDDVRAVVGGDDPLGALHRLVERSMVTRRGERLGLLRTVQAYAEAKLDDEGPVARHLAWFARHGAPEVLAAWDGPGHPRRLAERVGDLPNLAVGVARAVARGDGRSASRLALGAAQALRARGPLDEGIALLDAAMGVDDAAQRTDLLLARADLRVEAGALDEARLDLDALGGLDAARAARAARVEGNRWLALGALAEADAAYQRYHDLAHGKGAALLCLGAVRLEAGRLDEAGDLLEAAATALRQAGDPVHEASALGNLGIVRRRQGRADAARALYERSLALGEAIGERAGTASDHGNLAILDALAGRNAEARAHVEEAVRTFLACGMQVQACQQLGNLSQIALQQHDRPGALEAAARALALARAVGSPRLLATALRVRARAEQVGGDLDAAHGLLREALALQAQAGTPMAAWLCRVELARIDLPRDPGAALGWLADEGSPGDAGVEALAGALRGAAWAGLGDRAQARRHLEAAMEGLGTQPVGTAVEVLCIGARALGDAAWLARAEALVEGLPADAPSWGEVERARAAVQSTRT